MGECRSDMDCMSDDFCCAEIYMSGFDQEMEFTRCMITQVVDEQGMMEMDDMAWKMGCMGRGSGSIWLAASYLATATIFVSMTLF